jgi:hypothetical protein
MTSDTFTDWRKATYSHANGDCVEVAADQHVIGVQDTQARRGRPLEFPEAAWRAFVATVKRVDA